MTQAPIQLISTTGSAQWQAKAELFDYRQAANPVRAGLTEPIPLRQWDPALHQSGPTAVLPLDLSSELGCRAPATSPGLAANFLRIEAGEGLEAAANATSLLFYVLQGSGSLKRAGTPQLGWSAGDLFVLPAGEPPLLTAEATSVLYWVHDGPPAQPPRRRGQHRPLRANSLPRRPAAARTRPASRLSQRRSQQPAEPAAG